MPPDLRRQIDRSIKDGQRRFDSAVKDIRTRVNQAALQADLNRAMKRLDELSKQVQELARTVTSGPPRPPRTTARRTTTTRKAATTRRKTATRKPATSRSRPRRTAVTSTTPSVPEADGPVSTEVENPS